MNPLRFDTSDLYILILKDWNYRVKKNDERIVFYRSSRLIIWRIFSWKFLLGKTCLKVATRAKKPLEFIHANVCSLTHPNSFGKNKYFLLFINDFNRKTCVHYFKENFEVFNAFTNFKALVEKESDCAIMVVRFDRRDESIQKNLNNILKIMWCISLHNFTFSTK